MAGGPSGRWQVGEQLALKAVATPAGSLGGDPLEDPMKVVVRRKARELSHALDAERRAREHLLGALDPQIADVELEGHLLAPFEESREVVGSEPRVAGDRGERERLADVIANEAHRAPKAALLVRLDWPLERLVHVPHDVPVGRAQLAYSVGGLGPALERAAQLVEALVVEGAARQERLGQTLEARLELGPRHFEPVARLRADDLEI